MSCLHSSVITCQTEKGNLWYFFWVGGVLKMQTTKTLEDKNHVKPWNRAVIFVCKKKSFDARGLSLSEVLSSFLQGHLTESQAGHFVEGLGLSLPTSVNLNIGGAIRLIWQLPRTFVYILFHPETKVDNFLLTSHMLLDEITLTILMYVGSRLGSAFMYTVDALLTSQTEGYWSLIVMAFLQSCHGQNGSKVKSEKWRDHK